YDFFILRTLTITTPFLFYSYFTHPHLHSFPTRRSSDLNAWARDASVIDPVTQVLVDFRARTLNRGEARHERSVRVHGGLHHDSEDRKSTRLNSSHVATSYAVFCLKKKKNRKHNPKILN